MRHRLPIVRILAFWLLLAPLAAAQEDQSPLGDVARDLRKHKEEATSDKTAPTVIDNENLNQVMEDVRKAKPVAADKTVFSIDSASNKIKVTSPDVSCSLSFNGNASALLIRPVLIEDVPIAELLKLDGPGSIQDENLELSVFNGTDWDIREITVGLTLERAPGDDASFSAGAHMIPAAQNDAPTANLERRSDVTLLFHLKAEALPFSTTTLRENIGITPGPDEDWRWSIVEAKGIRPSESRPVPTQPTPAQ